MRSAFRASSAILKACVGRRFFLTAAGRMGLGPATMRVGDVVVVLYGGRFPFVLRAKSRAVEANANAEGNVQAKGEEYELVGYGFLLGVMRGEVMEEHVEEWREDVLYLIR